MTVSSQENDKSTASKALKRDSNNKLLANEHELSEEDQSLKSDLEVLVEHLKDSDHERYQLAIDQMGTYIKTSTSSMTAVPKPLKFLRPHYHDMQKVFDSWPSSSVKDGLSDILSVLAMTYADAKRDCLRYRLSSTKDNYLSWGHEYVRHLSIELGEERTSRIEKEEDIQSLKHLVISDIVPFFLKHNAEADAVDLLSEFEAIHSIVDMVDEENYNKVCLYLLSCVSLLPYPENTDFLKTAYRIYNGHQRSASAMLVAIRLDDQELIQNTWDQEKDVVLKRQLGFLLGRQSSWMTDDSDEDGMAAVDQALRNMTTFDYYRRASSSVGLIHAKHPEDIYKSHLEPDQGSFGKSAIDSAKQNLATTFASAFINAARAEDQLLIPHKENSSWIYKTKGAGQISATAGIGLVGLWDWESGFGALDKYQYSPTPEITAGALLGIGIMNCNVRNNDEPALAVLSEHLTSKSKEIQTSAIAGLGLAYAGSQREDLLEELSDIVTDTDAPMESSAFAALSLGLIFAGSCDGRVADQILQTLLERDAEYQTQLDSKWTRFMVLGLAFLYIGKQEEADPTLETLKVVDHKVARSAEVLVGILAYAGTGNVLKVQEMLHLTAEHENASTDEESDKEDADKEGNLSQAYATIGIAMIAMGEDVGTEMALRQFGHLMYYSDPMIRKAVPLALGLLSASNPQLKVFETLSRYSHDSDLEVAINAIFAMGMVGAGTNNARLAQLLRSLATYYAREPDCLFMVRIAQGLLHAGQGTMSINPFHTDRSICHRNGLAGLMTVLVAMIDSKSFILENSHWLLYYIAPALRTRLLITTDDMGEILPVSVRVGQAVDSFGPGNARKITGWVTQTTPVLLGFEQRAELATEEWTSLTPVLEGIVMLRKNPDYEE